MKSAWREITEILRRERLLAAARINPGATRQELQDLETHLGLGLPESLKSFLTEHNGQSDDAKVGAYVGSQLLSTKGIRAQWDNWRSIDEEDMNADCAEFMSSKPEGFIKPLYCNRHWIPLTHDDGGNHVGLDFDPDLKGTRGQVIVFGRDEDEKALFASSFDDFLTTLVTKLRSADWSFAESERE
jgi:cell wall assembly regulator SMI1